MRRLGKRFLAILLAACMFLQYMPVQAYAKMAAPAAEELTSQTYPSADHSPETVAAVSTADVENSSEVSFTFSNGAITACNPGSAAEIVIPDRI